MQAEIVHEGRSLKRFTLEPAGRRKRIVFQEDKAAIMNRWRHDWARIHRTVRQTNRTQAPDFIIRHPSEYDELADREGGMQ